MPSCAAVGHIDFHDAPDTPASNNLFSSVNVVVTNEADEILMIHPSDNDNDNRVYRALLRLNSWCRRF
ncbi:hypothetical protein [Streptosporangium sp. NPDC049644]|uniref:hypothetical protein n=1 Tax=Streptosporangium sp. NPDC049644 TaxID=3155507 RepID=UPI00343F94FA